MSVEVLISCMQQDDPVAMLRDSALQSNAVVINQCDVDATEELDYEGLHVRLVSSRERGLSRSRNMAIRNSSSDICIVSDDDEVYSTGYAAFVEKAYRDYPEADVILFQIEGMGKTYSDKPFQVGYLAALHFCSWNITFKRESIVSKNVWFDEKMGSGTGNGSGEEIKFLYSCLHAGLRLQYVPIQLARLEDRGESVWFKGFDVTYFRNRGWATARYLGKPLALLYGLYFAVRKRFLYKNECSFINALCAIVRGVFETR